MDAGPTPDGPYVPAAAGTAPDDAAIAEIAHALRLESWNIALRVVRDASERGVLPGLAGLGSTAQVANLPAFIGSLATVLTRPRPVRQIGTNPILTRLARDHVTAREAAGFSAREIVLEFLLLRRVLWRFIQERSDRLDAASVLSIEDRLNSILDEVIAECTVTYFNRATEALSEQGRRDSLTGLLNHQAFHARLDEELDRHRRYGHTLQVIYFDLDEFKDVNDTLGHAVGDEVLLALSRVISGSIRESDFAGRMGGDEFVICLVESSELAAHLFLDRLRARLTAELGSSGLPPTVSVSAGTAGFPTEADDARSLLVLADERQYADKRARKSAATTGDGQEPGTAAPERH